jgi:hypothetical protein
MAAVQLLAWTLAVAAPAAQPLTLDVRVFRGTEDVTDRSRVTVYRAGDRQSPVAQMRPGEPHRATVPAGLYDAQAIEEQDGRVLHLRWAERLVVMPYPDEGGHHLEVINLDTGYGALQVHGAAAGDELLLLAGTNPRSAVATAPGRAPYVLLVVPAGTYDLQVRRGSRRTAHPKLEIPLDRTRFLVLP